MAPKQSQVEKQEIEKVDESESVTVIYNGARLLSYAGHTYQADEEGGGKMMTKGKDGQLYNPSEVKRGNKSMNHGSIFNFVPGMNVVPKEIWEEMIAPTEVKNRAGKVIREEESTLGNLLDQGILEIFDPKAKQDAKNAPQTPGVADDLAAYSDKDARKLVENCMDAEKLLKMKKGLDPRRNQVAEMIDNQIMKLHGSGKAE